MTILKLYIYKDNSNQYIRQLSIPQIPFFFSYIFAYDFRLFFFVGEDTLGFYSRARTFFSTGVSLGGTGVYYTMLEFFYSVFGITKFSSLFSYFFSSFVYFDSSALTTAASGSFSSFFYTTSLVTSSFSSFFSSSFLSSLTSSFLSS